MKFNGFFISGRFSPLALVVLVLLASCFPGAKAPSVNPARTLDLEGDAAETKNPKAFGVVFAGPKGEVEAPSEITVVFNRPMRPLELAEGATVADGVVTLEIEGRPAASKLKGTWRWLGTSTLLFAPEEPLPRATSFKVTVAPGTRALDGSVLAKAYSFSFSTPRPELVRALPGEGFEGLASKPKIELRFNQPIDPKEVERAAKFSLKVGKGEKGKAVALRATRPKADAPALLEVTPVANLPLDTALALTLDKSLRGLEGVRPLGEDRAIAMRTYGPLRVRGLDCYRETPNKKCAARSSVRLDLNNRVAYNEWKAHVRIDPIGGGAAPKIEWRALEAETSRSQSETLWARLRAATRYQVTVTAGMKDEYGQTLKQDVVLPFETDDEWPEVEVGVSGDVFEAGKGKSVPIGAVNVPSYELFTAAPDETELARLLATEPSARERDPFDRAKQQIPSGKVESVRATAASNIQWVKRLDLESVIKRTLRGKSAAASGGPPASSRGPVVFSVRAPNVRRGGDPRLHVLSVTDLGITAKMSRFGSLAWVTRLSDGKAVPGAIVSVRGRNGAEIFATKTDAGGVAVIPSERYSPVMAEGRIDEGSIVVARLGDDWSYRRVSEMLDTWRYQPSSDPSGTLVPMGMLFTDRGIYKAGETVRAKGLFRVPTARGTETPVGREVTLLAFDVNDEKVFEHRAKLGSFGDFAVDVPIPPAAHLGSLQLRAELDAPANATTRDSFREGTASAVVQVSAYRPAEFKVSVEPGKAEYVRGETAGFVMRGDYLFGAPMSAGDVRYTVTRGPASFLLPGADGFVYDDGPYERDRLEANPRASEIAQATGKLGSRGDLAASAALSMPNQSGTELVTFEAEIEDVSRQTIAGRASTLVHPGDFYVAMKPPGAMFQAKGSSLKVELAAIEPSGRRRAGVPITVELVKRTWHSVAAESGEMGMHYDSRAVDKVMATCTATTAAQGLSACNVPLTEAGYYIVHASAADGRKNPVRASTSIYVLTANDGDALDVGWSMDDTSKLDIVADKKSYEVGDTATLLVKNPFREAEALITVERAGVYRRERRVLSGSMPTLKIPITEDMRPNAYVSVHLVRGRTKEAPAKTSKRARADVGAPAFRLGYHELVINPEARRLKVSLTPSRREFHPGESVDVDVSVTDREGKPVRSDVTFYAVDEGVLMLTGYKTPDPLPTFTAPRPLSVFSLETRDALAKVFLAAAGNGSVDKGDEGGGGGELRQDFRATAAFMPQVLAAAGKAHVSFKLPDSVTTYRLMAVVASESDRFGWSEAQIVSSRRLMARPALPRFLRAGDSLEAGVVLSSKGLPQTNVEVTAKVEGGLSLSGEAKRTVTLPANGNVEVRWPMVASRAGKAKWTFVAKGAGETDAVEIARDVTVPLSMESVALAGETTAAAGERLGDLRAMRDDVGGLDVRLASTALVGLAGGVEQLLEYPYGCTEQLVSRLVPLVSVRGMAQDYGLPLPKNVDGVAGETIQKIVRNQQGDGSFGYWNDSPAGSTWVTAYALWGLTQAKKHGQRVPEAVLTEAARSVRATVNGDLSKGGLRGAEAAFVADVLAESGQADPGLTSLLYESRAKLPLFGRALLAHAMIVAKMDSKSISELLRDLDNHLRVTTTGATVVDNVGDAYAVLLDSEARTTAMVLRALVAKEKGNALAARLARGLLGMRHGGTWRTTQETAWSLVALDEYRRQEEAAVPNFDARAFLGDNEIFSAEFRGRSVREKSTSLPADKLFKGGAGGSVLAFQAQGSGKLFYEARLRYAKRELPREGLDRGFFVRKWIRKVDPAQIQDALKVLPNETTGAVPASSLVLVDLVVVTPDPRENVVIDDPLPAGLEPVQSDLATTAQSLTLPEPADDGDGGDGDGERPANSSHYYHREYHDDRVLTFVEHMPAGLAHYRYLARATTFGRFVVPPTRAECMYEPEVFGRTGAASFEVKAR
ncbi:Ig-like domain-containing protein [Pendulispora brunnea]|uniref:Ig-like domain-containing protein n=1 Tax=Pendulispora brunnea TaxID=2905690 RepID=A0ABZ2KP94_9BACT